MSRVARNERPKSKPPHTRKSDPAPSPRTPPPWFRHDQPAKRAGRLNQLHHPKPVEPGREERATQVETPDSRTTNPTTNPRTRTEWFRHDQPAKRAGRLNQLHHPKPVEPGREERATQVETPDSRTTNPTTNPRTRTEWFRHDQPAKRAGRLNQLHHPKPVEPARERSERLSRNHPTPGSQNPTTTPRTRSPWFRHDPLADARRPAQPASGELTP